MTSFIPNIKNPFLKDYTDSSLLKRNYQFIRQSNNTKQNYQSKYNLSKKQYQTISTSFNPFGNNLYLTNNQQENHGFKKQGDQYELLSERQKSQSFLFSNSKQYFRSLDKNVIYKGLESLATKQIWKHQIQTQARKKLKDYGPQALRYNYVNMDNNQPKNNKKVSKKQLSNKQISSQYYGYKKNDSSPSQQKNKAKQKFKSSFHIINPSKQNYFKSIQQDRNQDLGSHQLLELNNKKNQHTTTNYRDKHSRSSIQNYESTFNRNASSSSGFVSPSQMYGSGQIKYSIKGPLNPISFDDQKAQVSLQDFDSLQNSRYVQNSRQSYSRKQDRRQEYNSKQAYNSKQEFYSRQENQTLQYKNKIYYKIL